MPHGGNNPRRANGHRRDAIRARWKSLGMPCAICGRAIDYSAPYYLPTPEGAPRRVNPDAFVVDEIFPVSLGGDPLDFANTQPAHARCNLAKGAKVFGPAEARSHDLSQPWDWDAQP